MYPISVNVYAVFATFLQSKVDPEERAAKAQADVRSDETAADNAPQMGYPVALEFFLTSNSPGPTPCLTLR